MKQVFQHARTGEITIAEVPAPQLLPNCVLVRIAASVVSAGTERASAEFAGKSLLQKARSRPDLVREVVSKVQRDGLLSAWQTVRTRLDQPQAPGYSSAGTVIAVGDGVTDLQPGDRVACAGAGFAVHAEVACVPRLLVAHVPARIPGRIPERGALEEVSFDEAAFATLGAVALHGIRTAEVKLGDLVAVIGLGLLGQLTVQLLKAAGCRVLGMDIDRSRAELAAHLGADAVAASASEFRDLCIDQSRGAGVDSVLITAETPSSDPVNLAGTVARERAIVVAVGTVGIDIERRAYYEKELDFRISRSYGPGRYDAAYEQKGRDYPIGYVRWTETRNMEAFLEFLAEKKVNVGSLITHRFPVERAQNAYELITGKSGKPFLGVVLQYSGTCEESRTLALVPEPVPVVHPSDVSAKNISVGLLGAGVFATGTLAPALRVEGNTALVGVCTASGARARYAAQKFGFRYCTTDEAKVIHDPSINTLVIATRNHLHAQQVLAGLREGKHVFCEKPLCLSEDELRSIVRAYLGIAVARRASLMVGYNRRFAPMIAKIKSFLAPISEPLTMHYRVNAGYLPPDHWVNDPEQGGGRILGEVCHFLDLLMFLAASPIVEVEGRALRSSRRYSGDNVLISIRFANGSEGTISYLANGDRAFSKERLEIFGGGAVAVLDDFRRLELVRDGRKQTIHSRWRQDKGHRAEWRAFAESMRQGQAAPIPFGELVGSTLATLRIQESVATGKRLVVDTAAFIDAALQTPSLD
jgi:predicted dehydrogenase/threonine dehydrogenase-like Zn-dependent dehydrogenase